MSPKARPGPNRARSARAASERAARTPREQAADRRRDTVIIAPRGEIDCSNVSQLVTAISHAIARDVAEVTVILDSVTFLDAAALGALVAGRQRCVAQGTTFTASCTIEKTRRLFEIAGLDFLLNA
jgi:anti-anti-sigma factor